VVAETSPFTFIGFTAIITQQHVAALTPGQSIYNTMLRQSRDISLLQIELIQLSPL